MVNTSQNLNASYGYLWWLNGKQSFMVPQSQLVFPGSWSPNAPVDMIAALGKNGQFINVVPSQNMTWIRMGDAPDSSLVPFLLNDYIWQYINDLSCSNGLNENEIPVVTVSPNPSSGEFVVHSSIPTHLELINALGQVIQDLRVEAGTTPVSVNEPGIYFIRLTENGTTSFLERIVIR
jgi:hypothetical protein